MRLAFRHGERVGQQESSIHKKGQRGAFSLRTGSGSGVGAGVVFLSIFSTAKSMAVVRPAMAAASPHWTPWEPTKLWPTAVPMKKPAYLVARLENACIFVDVLLMNSSLSLVDVGQCSVESG